jgi:8-oxo-dGTP pyrophosphatase MutT (NUDIX family)
MAIPRPTSRVIVLDDHDKVLLIHSTDGEYRGSGQPVWLTPGGGLDGKETYEEAAFRELREEVGLTVTQLGPCVWTRRLPFTLSDGVAREKHERYYICRVQHFEVGKVSQDILDLEAVGGFRWWSVGEILEATDQVFVPRTLGDLLPALLAGKFPERPLPVGT